MWLIIPVTNFWWGLPPAPPFSPSIFLSEYKDTSRCGQNFLECLKISWKSVLPYSLVHGTIFWNQEISSKISWNQEISWKLASLWVANLYKRRQIGSIPSHPSLSPTWQLTKVRNWCGDKYLTVWGTFPKLYMDVGRWTLKCQLFLCLYFSARLHVMHLNLKQKFYSPHPRILNRKSTVPYFL